MSTITHQPFNVGDILETPGHQSPRLYEVQGVHVGGMWVESVVELSCLDKAAPYAHIEARHMFVPIEMIEAGLTSGIFNLTHA